MAEPALNRQPLSLALGVLCTLAAWTFFLLGQLRFQFLDPDLWGRMAMGALIRQNGHFPYHDIFSYTAAGKPWTDHEWLSGLIFYELAAHYGQAGLLALKYAIILTLFGLLALLHRGVYRSNSLYMLTGVILFAPSLGLTFYSSVRAQVFTFLLLALFLVILEAVRLERLKPKALWWLSGLLVPWANLHGGAIIGWFLLVAYGVGEALATRQWKKGTPYLNAAGAGLLGVLLLNPYGPRYVAFLWDAWRMDRPNIGEWAPLQWGSSLDWNAQLLVVSSVILIALQWIFRQDKGRWITPSLLILGAVAGTVKAVRLQTALAILTLAFSPLMLQLALGITHQGWQRWAPRLRLSAEALAGLLLLAFAVRGIAFVQTAYPLWRLPVLDESSQLPLARVMRYPAGAIAYLKNSPYQGNLLTAFRYGEFALWNLYPQFKVAIDGRYEEVYTQAQYLDVSRFYFTVKATHPQAVNYLQKSGADFVLVELRQPVFASMTYNPDWRMIYGDFHYALFARKRGLERFPPYESRFTTLPGKRLTLDDYLGEAEFRRFRQAP